MSEIFLYKEELKEILFKKCTLSSIEEPAILCHILINLEFSQHVFENSWNIKFHKNFFHWETSFPRVHVERQPDGHGGANSFFTILRTSLKMYLFYWGVSKCFLILSKVHQITATKSPTFIRVSEHYLQNPLIGERPRPVSNLLPTPVTQTLVLRD
jgi:hypothetical protein